MGIIPFKANPAGPAASSPARVAGGALRLVEAVFQQLLRVDVPELPGLLLPGDLLVVNTTATLPAQVRVSAELAVHFSGPRPDGSWLTELRQVTGKTTAPNGRGYPGQRLILPGGVVLTLEARATNRLWRARLPSIFGRFGKPICRSGCLDTTSSCATIYAKTCRHGGCSKRKKRCISPAPPTPGRFARSCNSC